MQANGRNALMMIAEKLVFIGGLRRQFQVGEELPCKKITQRYGRVNFLSELR
jgi:hypothetical protein